jgi:hypothetical protein
MKRSFLRKLIILFPAILAFIFIILLILRNPLLNAAVKKAQSKFLNQYGAKLSVQQAVFTGYNNISLRNVMIIPENGDTLLFADTLNVRPSIWKLISGTISLQHVYASGVKVSVSNRNGVWNYNNFLRSRKDSSTTGEKNYSRFFNSSLDRVFNLAPQKSEMNNIRLLFRNDSVVKSLRLVSFHSDENSIQGLGEDEGNLRQWQWTGSFSQSDHTLNISIYPLNKKGFIPLLPELTGTYLDFDTFRLELNGYSNSGNNFTAEAKTAVKGFSIFHKKISDDTVKISSAAFNCDFRSGKDFIMIDSSSKAELGEISLQPFAYYSSAKEKIYKLDIRTDSVNGTGFFSSLPAGMFDEVRDLEANGALKFRLHFSINSSRPDDVEFESEMKKIKFRLTRYGQAGLLKLNSDFIHPVYENGRYIRSVDVSPQNPYFTPLDKISIHLVNAIMTSEDGSFFYHNGFNEEAFRKSIAANFKAGRFVRGGSTITMQLVKNVFLTRKKTVARKAEEALIVWLIENNGLCTKHRMLEVYLNIIELGPGVYGVGEASEFYFSKKPEDIKLNEAIFLASLLPHPKWYKSSFDSTGNLKPHFADYYRLVSNFMLKKELITQEEYDKLTPEVQLKGPAKEIIMPEEKEGFLHRLFNF